MGWEGFRIGAGPRHPEQVAAQTRLQSQALEAPSCCAAGAGTGESQEALGRQKPSSGGQAGNTKLSRGRPARPTGPPR